MAIIIAYDTYDLDIVGHPSESQVLLDKGVPSLRCKHLTSLQGNPHLGKAAEEEGWEGSW